MHYDWIATAAFDLDNIIGTSPIVAGVYEDVIAIFEYSAVHADTRGVNAEVEVVGVIKILDKYWGPTEGNGHKLILRGPGSRCLDCPEKCVVGVYVDWIQMVLYDSEWKAKVCFVYFRHFSFID